MKIGMLWFDNDPKMSLENKISKALAYYQDKYHMQANSVWVHPTMIAEGNIVLSGAVIKKNRSVMVNHFWIGTEDS